MKVRIQKPMYVQPAGGALGWHDKGAELELAPGSPVSIFMQALDDEAKTAIDAEAKRRQQQQPWQYASDGRYTPQFWFTEPIRESGPPLGYVPPKPA
jgi:hypothetical protein